MSSPADSTPGVQVRIQLEHTGFKLDAYLSLPARGVTAIFGHSGSGKTSLLRCIAGLETKAKASLRFKGALWADSETGFFLPVHQRPIAYVFQEACLFPHLTVQGNLEYGRRRRKTSKAPEQASIITLLGIEHLLNRAPETLSGGERQRVAIARALLSGPELLLMDEPLAALDQPRKREILPYLERLHAELEIPIIYVTHSAEEVIRLADHLVVLEDGKVSASGPLQETLARLDLPDHLHTDFGVLVEATVLSYDATYGLLRSSFPGGDITLPHAPMAVGTPLRLQIRSRDVSLSLDTPTGSSILNLIPCTVTAEMRPDGASHVLVRLDAGGTPLLARITRLSHDRLGLRPGLKVCAQVKAVALAN